MKKFTFLYIVIASILLCTIPFKDLSAQCSKAINVSDSIILKELYSESIYSTFENPISQWENIRLIDTLGECRVDSLYIECWGDPFIVIKNGIDLPFLSSLTLSECHFDYYEGIFDKENFPLLKTLNITNPIIDQSISLNPQLPDFDLPNLEELILIGFFVDNSMLPDFDKMPNLRTLRLNWMFGINGELPNFSKLEKLEILEIDNLPNLVGSIPNFSNLPNLKSITLRNSFSGELPNFSHISNLQHLVLQDNLISGDIPDFINLPLLETLNISDNQFRGAIPNFNSIPLLEELNLSDNQLAGVIPNFHNLPLLNKLAFCGGDNDFIGPIPTLENCPLLNTNDVDFSCVRPAPETSGCSISESDSLELVNFYQTTNGENWQVNNGWLTENMTSWWGIDFVDTLGKCRVNKILIRGIPDAVELPTLNIPFLEELIIDYNNFTGTIPDLSNLTNLKILNLGSNNFEGALPDLSTFTKLEELNLSQNQLTGELPDFANSPSLRKINLGDNLISGTLLDFQTIPNLNYLNISENQLTGSIPNFTNLANLYTLNVANNQLTGGLVNFSNLPVLQSLFVQNNQLNGRIPNFNNMPLLEELIVCDNNFEGTAPNFSFAPLLNIDAIDFSCLQAAKVRGYAYYDANENCIYDEGDITLPNGLVSINNGANYQPIDENGYFEIALEIGTSVITFIQTSPLWQTACEDTYTITSNTLNDVTDIEFANQPNIDCTELTVDIGTPFLRRCFKNTYTVQYCNQGTQPAADAYIEINFEDEIIPLSASIPYEENSNLLTFQLGEIGIGECGSFTVMDSVSCIAPLSSTGCVEAHIYPDEYCVIPSALWDRANLAVNAFCLDNDSVQFVIENLGEDMDTPSSYRMYEEDIMTVQEEFILPSGAAKTLNYGADGSTYRIVVDQTPGHPSQDNPQAFFEFCGDGNFSTGFINSQLLPDKDEFLDIDCEEIIGSYDPNDKLVTPTGVGESHDIYKGDELTYKIRFQNTGNDTAFTVVLVDTLDFEHLNISTLEVLNSSHPYTLSIEDAQILTFTFNDILLVDSTTNEAGSHGFVTFKIDQFKENEIGDVIENKAYIYFDYNEAIVTPTVFNTVAEPRVAANFQFIPLTVGVENVLTNHLFAKVYPNPASEVFYIELPNEVLHRYPNLQLEMYNTKGQTVVSSQFNYSKQSIDIADLTKGVFYYKLFSNTNTVANGKLLIQ